MTDAIVGEVTAEQVTAAASAGEEAKIKTSFTSDYQFMLIILVISQLALIGGLGFYIFKQLTSAISQPLYFKLTENQQIIEPSLLDVPAKGNAFVLNLANEAINIAYTFNYRNLTNQIEQLKYYFDDRGLKTYIKVLQEDDYMKKVIPQKLIVSAKALRAPQIQREGIFRERYVWRIKMPLEVSYRSKERLMHREVDIDIVMWRVPETESPSGIKITSYKSKLIRRYESDLNAQQQTGLL